LEDHEQHRNEVVANAVAIARVGQRLDAALVRLELDRIGLLRVQQPRKEEREDSEPDRYQDEEENGNGGPEHRRRAVQGMPGTEPGLFIARAPGTVKEATTAIPRSP